MKSIINSKVKNILQTIPKDNGIILEEFGESFWINLVIELENGQLIQLNEYDCQLYELDKLNLIKAELVQENYKLTDLEGKIIISLTDYDGDFALVLENELCLSSSGSPGGNYPYIYPNHEE